MANGEATEAGAVAELASAALAPITLDGATAPIARDSDGDLASLERFLDRPVRIREGAHLNSVGSFNDYVNLHKNTNSIITADQDSLSFGAIIDYHGGSVAGNKDHRANLVLEHTTGMKAWLSRHNKRMGQEEFGLFLEENAADIVDPAAATMIQVATSLRAVKNVDFESKIALDNGAYTFLYKEEIKGTYADGKVEVPQSFFLGIVPFRGMAEAYKIEAKLRYRISSGKLELWYSIPELERLIEQAFLEVRDSIGKATALPVFDGAI